MVSVPDHSLSFYFTKQQIYLNTESKWGSRKKNSDVLKITIKTFF